MLRHAAFFIGGCITIILAQLAYALFSAHRATNATVVSSGPVSATVTISVAQNPQALLPLKDPSALLDRIIGLKDDEKAKIRAALASGLVTAIRVESSVAGESHWIEVPSSASQLASQGSSSVQFGQTQLHIEKIDKPNRPTGATPEAAAHQ